LENTRRLFLLLAVLAGVFLLGTFGYMAIEGWSFWDSLYMVIITVATVGFREVGALSNVGRIYTIGIILVGVGLMGVTLSNFTALLVGGRIRQILRAGKMQKRILKMKNHYIVCGAGRMGYEAIKELVGEKRNLVVIENDTDIVQKLDDEGVPVIKGDATEDDVLRSAGVEKAKGLLAALPQDADNVYVSLTARGLNPSLFIIARGTDELSEKKLLKAGADRVILPYQIGGRRMASILVRPEIVDFLELVMGKDELSLRMEIVTVNPKSKLDGLTLKESNIRHDSGGALVMGVLREDKMIPNPPGDLRLLAGDQLLVLGHPEQIALVEQMAG
jgi:voltage-gated potassium channel